MTEAHETDGSNTEAASATAGLRSYIEVPWEQLNPVLRRVVTTKLEQALAEFLAEEARGSAQMLVTIASLDVGAVIRHSPLASPERREKAADDIDVTMAMYTAQIANGSERSRVAITSAFRAALAKLHGGE